jgi:hypothetical protein
MAAEFFIGVSATEKGRKALHKHGATKLLVMWSGDSLESVSVNAYNTLVNLSADMLEDRIGLLLSMKMTHRIYETVTASDVSSALVDSALMLMSNLTTVQEGAHAALMSDDPALVGQRMRRIVEKFLTTPPKSDGIDAWQHVSTILCNVSQVQDGRDLLRRRSTNILPRLVLQLQSPNPVRRRGAASSIRNCCYETMDHDWLLHEVGIVGHLLLPLAGPEPLTEAERDGLLEMVKEVLDKEGSNKVRENDDATKEAILNALYLLCTSKVSRQFLRRVRAYPIVRNLDLVETNEKNKEIIYNIVSFLIRDEEEGDNEAILGKAVDDGNGLGAADDLPASNYHQNEGPNFLGQRDVDELDTESEMHTVD